MDGKQKRVKELEQFASQPGFWQEQEKATAISQELGRAKEEIDEFDNLQSELELIKSAGSESDIDGFEKKLREKEQRIFLGGKYDKGNALMQISAGAGGQDSQDWATMLLRMYERYCERQGFSVKILHQSFGQAGGPEGRIGVKQVALEIKGHYAYGFLKKEAGIHRLVRLSPFSAKSLRHTSFASVEVLPELGKLEEAELNIRPEDIQLDTFRASGPGGQYVNKRESAVRVTHLPTGIVATCQTERLQGLNRDKAMKVLSGRIFQLKEEERQKTLTKMKGNKSASWGSQIRSYVVHPYKMVKDLRTDVETANVEAILDGELDDFIEAEIRI